MGSDVIFTQAVTSGEYGRNDHVNPTPAKYGRTFDNIQCYDCQLFRYYDYNFYNPSRRTVS